MADKLRAKKDRAAIRFSWFNRHRLKLNKWYESLDIAIQRKVFPDTPDCELPYIWNRITQEERNRLYKKFEKQTKETSVQSTASNYYDDQIVNKYYKRNG